jgi:type IV pilus assembly protein PilO
MMKKGNKISIDSVSPLIEKIEQLSKIQRISITVSVFVVLLGAFVYFAYLPKFQEIDKLKKELTTQQNNLATAKKNAQELNTYRAKMKAAEEQFEIAKMALPEKEEIPSLLASISQSGKDSGLEFLLFQPKPEVKKDFFAEIPVAISVSGGYHNVAMFFDKVANLSRIVNINNITIKPQKSGEELVTNCTAVTYKFVESTPQGKKEKKK